MYIPWPWPIERRTSDPNLALVGIDMDRALARRVPLLLPVCRKKMYYSEYLTAARIERRGKNMESS